MLAPHTETDERAAFEAAVLREQPSLCAFAISLIRDRSRADDLVQETILRAIMQRDKFTPGTNLSAWLFTLLRNIFRSQWRKRRREVEDPDLIHARALTVGGAEDEEARQDFTKMLGVLACLSQEYRDVIIAIGYLGMQYNQAADILRCAEGTIKSRVSRARDRLAQMMRDVSEVKFDAGAIVTAAQAIPRGHPMHQIAEAYIELYGPLVTEEVSTAAISEADMAWARLVESGGVDLDDFDGGFYAGCDRT